MEISPPANGNCVAKRKRGRPPCTAESFWGRVDRTAEDDCWVWRGWRSPTGYGYLKWGNKQQRAHRIAWSLTNGPIPDGMLVCHHCDTPSCCNPKHLFIGSAADNNADKARKGRALSGNRHPSRTTPERHARGERSGASRLTEPQVIDVLRKAALGHSHRSIAQELGVSTPTISSIVAGKAWRHVSRRAVTPSFSFITNRLAVGDVNSRAVPGWAGIVSILASAHGDEQLGVPATEAGVPVLAVDIRDGHPGLDSQIDKICWFVSNRIMDGCVLIHCVTGLSRSVAACAAYLCRYAGMSLNQALGLIARRRPGTIPWDGYKVEITTWLRLDELATKGPRS